MISCMLGKEKNRQDYVQVVNPMYLSYMLHVYFLLHNRSPKIQNQIILQIIVLKSKGEHWIQQLFMN